VGGGAWGWGSWAGGMHRRDGETGYSRVDTRGAATAGSGGTTAPAPRSHTTTQHAASSEDAAFRGADRPVVAVEAATSLAAQDQTLLPAQYFLHVVVFSHCVVYNKKIKK
jgi:hypothetical protein